MSDILIKGMEMPESCQKCPFFDYEQGFCFASGVKGNNGWYEFTLCHGGIKDGRHDDCPLIPVSPHGRLIDADALLSKDYQVYNEYGDAIGRRNLSVYDIQDAPTIISADKEDE